MARRRTLGTVVGQHNHWRARYQREGQRHVPGRTFRTEELAWAWLRSEQTLIDRGEWTPPAARREKQRAAEQREAETSTPFGAYARDWIANRTTPRGTPLAPRTVSEYHSYLEGPLADFAGRQLADVSRADVKAWWQRFADKPRYRHHAYAFAKSVYKAAVKDGLLDANPWDIDNAARVVLQTPKTVRATMINDLTPEDVQRVADATQPEQWQALVLLLAWTGLRPGEAFGLQRRDIKTSYIDGIPCWRIHVARAVSRSRTPDGIRVDTIGTPKTPESIRHVWLPPHLVPAMEDHLDRFSQPRAEGLIFPSTNEALPFATTQQVAGTTGKQRRDRTGGKVRPPSGFNGARESIGMPGLRLYDLRHWARRILLSAGMGELAVEQYMGHRLPAVQGAYAVLDPRQVWPVMLRCSDLAGWTPSAAAPAGRDTAVLLNEMTAEQLAAAVSAMSPDQLAVLVPTLSPEALVRLLGTQGRP